MLGSPCVGCATPIPSLRFAILSPRGSRASTAQPTPAPGEQRGALLGGHADVEFNPASESALAVTAAQLCALVVCDDQPSRFTPKVPTAIPLDYKSSMGSVRGIAVPAGTPDAAINAMDLAGKKSLANSENQEKPEQIMLPTRYMGPKEYTAYWAEFEKTDKAVLDATSK